MRETWRACLKRQARGRGDGIDARLRRARLHAGLAVMRIVEDDNREILRLLDADRGEAAQAHEEVAVAGDHGDAAVGPRQRKSKPDHRGAAHRAPQIEIERMVAGRCGIVSRRAKPGDDEKIATVGQKLLHEVAAVKHHRVHCLRPISRCDNRIAT